MDVALASALANAAGEAVRCGRGGDDRPQVHVAVGNVDEQRAVRREPLEIPAKGFARQQVHGDCVGGKGVDDDDDDEAVRLVGKRQPSL